MVLLPEGWFALDAVTEEQIDALSPDGVFMVKGKGEVESARREREAFKYMLLEFDLHYPRSDDPRVFSQGSRAHRALSDEGRRLDFPWPLLKALEEFYEKGCWSEAQVRWFDYTDPKHL